MFFYYKQVDNALFCVILLTKHMVIMTVANTKKVYNKLKKQNGERVARTIRDASLLNLSDIVPMLEFAGNDPKRINLLLPVIEAKYNLPHKRTNSDKNPFQLLDMAGYDSFYVTSLEQQNSIRKFFRHDEELCTFNDEYRFQNNYTIHAIKRGADKIKPAQTPAREDEYGTSVISIQINKQTGYLSIKNRYNHTVSCPDSTFNNNPDNIIPGLTMSLTRYFNIPLNSTNLPDHFAWMNNKFMLYDYEIQGQMFGKNWYTDRRGNVIKVDTNSELMFDCMLLDLKTKKFRMLNSFFSENCQEFQILKNLFKNGKIQIQENPKNKKQRLLSVNGQHIATLQDGYMVELTLANIKEIRTDMAIFFKLKEINLPDTKFIWDSFFSKVMSNRTLKTVNIPKAIHLGHGFLFGCTHVTTLNAPMVKTVGWQALQYNNVLKKLYMPNLEHIGETNDDTKESDWCNQILNSNEVLTYAYVPKLKKTMPHEYARLHKIVTQNTQKNLIAQQSKNHIRGA